MADAINAAALEAKTPITFGSLSMQSANAVRIIGGTITGTSGSFSSLEVTGTTEAYFILNPSGSAETKFYHNTSTGLFGIGSTNSSSVYANAVFWNGGDASCPSYWSGVIAAPGFTLRDPSNATVWATITGSSTTFTITASGTNKSLTLTPSGTGSVVISSSQLRMATTKTPSSATDTGVAGSICRDENYIYVCTATNTWKRAAIATW